MVYCHIQCVVPVTTDLLKDDVDVSSNKLSYLLPLSGLHRVVTVLVVSKVLKGNFGLHQALFYNTSVFHVFSVRI